jgi:hypothetical protein
LKRLLVLITQLRMRRMDGRSLTCKSTRFCLLTQAQQCVSQRYFGVGQFEAESLVEDFRV